MKEYYRGDTSWPLDIPTKESPDFTQDEVGG
jgi:hypothetical protein